MMKQLIATFLCGFARVLTGVQARWYLDSHSSRPRIYFANHRSHGDFMLIWASLPKYLRVQTRPVAAADYWLGSHLRRYLIQQVFRGVLIQRQRELQADNPIELMSQALAQGDSLILFPEGTRNTSEQLLAFKSGIFHLAQAHPEVELVPVWIENLGRVLPKGSFIPVPLLCSINFGPALTRIKGETKAEFLLRAKQAIEQLAPNELGANHE